MPLDIRNHKVIIVVFAMPECPACEEYIPRLATIVSDRSKKGDPFTIWEGSNGKLDLSHIPIFIYDVTSSNEALQEFANRFNIQATPTTLVLRQPSGAFRAEGGLGNHQISALLDIAKQYKMD